MGGKNEKPKRGVLKWETMSINGPIQILLHKSKKERTEVISRLLFTFVRHKLQEYLSFSNIFSYLFHNYDVTSYSLNHILKVCKVSLKNQHALLKAI